MDFKFAGEELVRSSEAEYTIVRPGRLVTEPGAQGKMKFGQNNGSFLSGVVQTNFSFLSPINHLWLISYKVLQVREQTLQHCALLQVAHRTRPTQPLNAHARKKKPLMQANSCQIFLF